MKTVFLLFSNWLTWWLGKMSFLSKLIVSFSSALPSARFPGKGNFLILYKKSNSQKDYFFSFCCKHGSSSQRRKGSNDNNPSFSNIMEFDSWQRDWRYIWVSSSVYRVLWLRSHSWPAEMPALTHKPWLSCHYKSPNSFQGISVLGPFNRYSRFGRNYHIFRNY